MCEVRVYVRYACVDREAPCSKVEHRSETQTREEFEWPQWAKIKVRGVYTLDLSSAVSHATDVLCY